MGHIVGVNFGVYGFSPSGDYAQKPIDIMPETRCMAIPKPTACACRISDGEPHHSTEIYESLRGRVEVVSSLILPYRTLTRAEYLRRRSDGP